MKDSKVDLVSWKRFITSSLVVVPKLLGSTCEFQFENSQISIELPAASELKDKTEDSKLRITAYKKQNEREIPTRVAIKSVDVLVNLNRKITIPDQVLARQPNVIDLLSEKQQEHLNKLSDDYGDVASRAFDLWIRVLRWKSSNGSICRPEIHGAESGWATYLLDNSTKQRLWAGPHRLTLRVHDAITPAHWRAAEETLRRGKASPVYIDLMFDGIEQYKLGDLRRSVVDLAVACEAFMRSEVLHSLPKGLTDSVLKYINEANIRQVLSHLYKDTLSVEQRKFLKDIDSTLQQLFNARNTILHSGHKKDLTSADCEKYIEATKKLITKIVQSQ